MTETVTITYGESVENHVGNQQIGEKSDHGITCENLEKMEKKLKKLGFTCEIIDLKKKLDVKYHEDTDNATILVIRNFVNTFFKDVTAHSTMLQQLVNLDWDQKALMKGKVVNKHARYNLCFANFSQEPDYENGKGRVYDFEKIKILGDIKKFLKRLLGEDLNAEGNYYYDIKKCYISYHGDTERKIVVGIRFGATFPLYFQWYKNTESISEPYEISLNSGDLYIMSDKAVGHDWKKRSILTLRHAAGYIVN